MVVGMVEGLVGSSKEEQLLSPDGSCPPRCAKIPILTGPSGPSGPSPALRQVAGDPGAERHLRRVEDRAAEGSRSRRGVRDRAPGGRPPDSNGWGVWGTRWEIRVKTFGKLGFNGFVMGFWIIH